MIGSFPLSTPSSSDVVLLRLSNPRLQQRAVGVRRDKRKRSHRVEAVCILYVQWHGPAEELLFLQERAHERRERKNDGNGAKYFSPLFLARIEVDLGGA
jgi:hypothetical protein